MANAPQLQLAQCDQPVPTLTENLNLFKIILAIDRKTILRTLPLAVLLAVLAVQACSEAKPYIDPTRYDQAGLATQGPRPRLFAKALPTGETLPDAITADALQMGWACLDLPARPRPRLLPAKGDGLVRWIERDADDLDWLLVALDLATRTATQEYALPGADAWPMAQGVLVRQGPLYPETAEELHALGWAASLAEAASAVALADQPTASGPLWAIGMATAPTIVLADVLSVAAAPWGTHAWAVSQSEDASPVLWEIATADEVTLTQAGTALRVWAVAEDGAVAILRGHGANGPETQLASRGQAERLRLGPDGLALAVVADGVLLHGVDGQLWRLHLDGSPPQPLADALPGDRLMTWGGQPAVVRPLPDNHWMLLWFDGSRLHEVTAIGPTTWLAAWPMRLSLVLALMGHDSNGTGSVDPLRDEADVCLIARTIAPQPMPQRRGPRPLRRLWFGYE